jgi:hypothetical protein
MEKLHSFKSKYNGGELTSGLLRVLEENPMKVLPFLLFGESSVPNLISLGES